MINTENTVSRNMRVLELEKIFKKLADITSLADTANLAVNLIPSTNISEVTELLNQTTDAHMLIARFGAPSFGSAKSANSSLTRAQMGGVLTMRELLDIGELLRVIRSLKEWRERSGNEIDTSIEYLFNGLFPNKYFEEKLFFCIQSEDEMNDHASPALADIRRKMRSAQLSIRDRLDKIIKSSSYSKVLQDSIVTQRDGRFVVPVKFEHRGDFPGLVHDTSSSGATLFIEPMAVVEVNNELKVLQSKEKDEIERILAELSAEVSQFADSTKESFEALLQLDLIFAKAKLAYDMNASKPRLNTEGRIYLKNARHPLIDKKNVVPITVSLGIEYDTLVITGPNTGGKTVTLKTIGLLTLMTMCGLMIPVDDNSDVAIFDKVLADIGDEQSIEQSLSTFSSHMINIISILEQSSNSCLVLLDELGAGTDPVEGAALACSILMKLRSMNATVAATTHYAELKSFALDTEGVENACCEFDVKTLRPTYRLLIGVPGRSNAFAISERLGLSVGVIENAKSLISEEDLRFENVVGSLESARQSAEKERAEIEKIRLELSESRKNTDNKLKDIERQKEKTIEKAREDAKRIVDGARAESNRLLGELEDLRKQISTGNAGDMVLKARAAAKSGIEKLENIADPVDAKLKKDNYKLPRALKPGDMVLITDIDKKATVVEPADSSGLVLVLAGIITTRINVSRLKLIEDKSVVKENKKTTGIKVSGIGSRVGRSAETELDLRGQSSDEAIMELDRFIDNSVMSGITNIMIIHGKGTGVLRKAVHQHLKHHRNIRTFRLGVFGEGEDGVSIAELK